MAGNIFGGGFFGKPIPLSGQPGAQVPLVGPAQAQFQRPQGQLGVVPPVAAPQAAMGPQGPVPMGQKKDCPVCRG